ncbi:pyridoxamine 5'-phosphate oxidase family protein [Allosphingosinicella flava]|uniref:Pyridoxamine 5'-phosphate oxidase family protein n=1 Tax=Allosphingosinicella flava TaxID=2771430 RepID=A0A7T2GJ50_9SPHN|nr:pyridoxamine 5'-phosphate oxidase family protein [Sphingosinicella flava]QPQ54483.1 pyridoxamine 5'-phosphate oxidase family protein [Sphingosinicella flava]
MPDKTLADIAEKLRDIDFAILSTRTENGAIAGRPMSNNREVDYDGDSYYFTYDSTRTVEDITRDDQVALNFQDKSGIVGQRPFFVAVEGRAELIRDKAQFAERWSKGLDRWFEQGIDTPGLVMIRVRAQRLHYWDGMDEGEIAL